MIVVDICESDFSASLYPAPSFFLQASQLYNIQCTRAMINTFYNGSYYLIESFGNRMI